MEHGPENAVGSGFITEIAVVSEFLQPDLRLLNGMTERRWKRHG